MSGPNVIFILADDLGYGDLGLYGNPAIRTPHLDQLGRTGIRLDQHYAGSPLCAPSRATLLTGRDHHRTGAVDVPSNRGLDRISLREQTLADLFAAGGYTTGMVGKWHNGVHDLRYHPQARGFDHFTGFLNGGMDYHDWVLDDHGQSRAADGRYLTDVFTDEAVAFIEQHRQQPFFLYLAYNAPHIPLQAPARLIEPYKAAGLPPNVAILYAMIEQLDAGVGRILETLERHGLSEQTLVVFTSDNGPQMHGGLERFNGPFSGAKGQALEGGVRVPCLLRWPGGLPGGVQRHEMTHFADWLPTLAALTGLKPAGLPLDGGDFSPLLRGDLHSLPTRRFWQHNRYTPVRRCNGGMRDGDWKLYWPMREGANWKDPHDNDLYREGMTSPHCLRPVETDLPQRTIAPVQPAQLYDLAKDPGETENLAAAHPQRLDRMIDAWDSWWDEVTAGWADTYRLNTEEE